MSHCLTALIRHGTYRQQDNTPSAHQPWPLTAEGEAQAQAAAETIDQLLQQHGWQLHPVIDSSELLRGWQTATVLAETLNRQGHSLTVESFSALAERGLGSAANLDINEIEHLLAQDPRCAPPPRDWKSNTFFRLPVAGAESLEEAGKRVAAHLQTRSELVEDTCTAPLLKLFVGHGAAFRHAAWQLGALALEELPRLSMHHCQPVVLQPGQSPGQAWQHIAGDWKQRYPNDIHYD